ncbi:hypothetical protein BT67DRAFT_257856 [Trichocladium antarcticum]|uniref:Uncharacterized protein n=1 Tax=Trichocladium antarcticum TaxID=1450529 RepID=A0AAN6UMC0_9PEZI|nr:hypothetical protein BT67DRAFT_257856 [Trichocladium antarcticum]
MAAMDSLVSSILLQRPCSKVPGWYLACVATPCNLNAALVRNFVWPASLPGSLGRYKGRRSNSSRQLRCLGAGQAQYDHVLLGGPVSSTRGWPACAGSVWLGPGVDEAAGACRVVPTASSLRRAERRRDSRGDNTTYQVVHAEPFVAGPRGVGGGGGDGGKAAKPRARSWRRCALTPYTRFLAAGGTGRCSSNAGAGRVTEEEQAHREGPLKHGLGCEAAKERVAMLRRGSRKSASAAWWRQQSCRSSTLPTPCDQGAVFRTGD